jgi:hypothetical protein
MHCSFLKFTLVLNFVLLFWKLLVVEFLLGTSETLLCPVSDPQANFIPLLDVGLLLLMFAGMLTYLEPKLFLLITFYSGSFFLLKY